tara:strand:+ start:101 stop:256 length:156 start_codon:yes stop_codon:yes gene_type:complete
MFHKRKEEEEKELAKQEQDENHDEESEDQKGLNIHKACSEMSIYQCVNKTN